MYKNKIACFILVIAAAMTLTMEEASAQQFDNNMVFNISGLYMRAKDTDMYYDFAGFSLRLGYFAMDYTEMFLETRFATGLDLADEIDYTMDWGIYAGLTQYLPINEAFAFYARGRVGVMINDWEMERVYYYNEGCGCWQGVDEGDTDTYFSCGVGAGASILLGERISLELGYDYFAHDGKSKYEDKNWIGYHTFHAGIDIKF
ncbi:MAG: outer membrane beta-barrel protein [Lentisphaerae bacterium]|jgi:opacity protein-like surface antigen|nr:outer membrane beta-barrel protein [Lentisphaerota bacterium]